MRMKVDFLERQKNSKMGRWNNLWQQFIGKAAFIIYTVQGHTLQAYTTELCETKYNLMCKTKWLLVRKKLF